MIMAYIIRTNGEVETVYPENGTDFSLEEMKKVVGGWIETVRLKKKKFMVVNEEGKLMGLDYNASATSLFQSESLYPAGSDYIVGDVLVCDYNQIK